MKKIIRSCTGLRQIRRPNDHWLLGFLPTKSTLSIANFVTEVPGDLYSNGEEIYIHFHQKDGQWIPYQHYNGSLDNPNTVLVRFGEGFHYSLSMDAELMQLTPFPPLKYVEYAVEMHDVDSASITFAPIWVHEDKGDVEAEQLCKKLHGYLFAGNTVNYSADLTGRFKVLEFDKISGEKIGEVITGESSYDENQYFQMTE